MANFFISMGFLVYPLTLLSILALALIINRIIFFNKQRKSGYQETYKNLSSILIENKNKEKNLRDEVISQLLSETQESLESGINLLRIIAVLSPMLGLLGTVLGMIQSFDAVANFNGPVSPSLIADGISVAMLTTAYGLFIALPCLFFAFFFSRIADKNITKITNQLNKESLRLEGVKLD